MAWQLYLPKEWVEDLVRREKAGVPRELEFATKPAIALAQIEHLMNQGAPKHCVLADAGYGVDTAFRERLSELGLTYVVGVTGQVTVWPPGHAPLPPEPYSGRGAVPTRQRLGGAAQQRPLSIKEVAFELRPSQWQTLQWREGTNFTLRSRFARVRVRAAHRDHKRTQLRVLKQWVLIEWLEGHREPMKYWLCPRCLRTCRLSAWSLKPRCAGASSATTKTSSRNWAWATTKEEAGAGSIITRA